jgi:hypothetical protein
MLAYSRSKSIGVQKQGEDRRVVSGVLEDELYAMACELAVHWPTLTIESVQAKMKRFTTSRCSLAESVFTQAEGWKLGSELDARIKKELGRKGCRHMAVLMVECCRNLVRAEFTREFIAAKQEEPKTEPKTFLEQFCARYPSLKEYLRLQ